MHIIPRVLLLLALLVILSSSSARELRPSEHGLIYQAQTPSPAENAPSQSEMKKFFGGTDTTPEVALPKAMNSSDPAWMNATERRRRQAGKGDHLKQALLVATLVCGITGGVFLLVAGFVFLFRFKAKKNQVDNKKPVAVEQPQPSPSPPIPATSTPDKKMSN